MADNFLIDEDSVVSLKDVIDEEQELQDTANAVLGDSDDTNCTYPKGYVSRQAVYACATCSTSTESSGAGICLACSLRCHEGHDLYELYSKRYFCCDCGNSKFTDTPCQLYPDKDPINSKNSYNHNYQGLYCSCNRPYPDTEDEIDDVMLQCIVCEDWYHSRHLGHSPPESYEEMVCDKCMERLPFLRCYQIHFSQRNGEEIINVTDKSDETNDTNSDPCNATNHSHTNEAHSNTSESHSHTSEAHSNTSESHSHTSEAHSNTSEPHTSEAHSNTSEPHTSEAHSNTNVSHSHTSEAHSNTSVSHSHTSEARSNTTAHTKKAQNDTLLLEESCLAEKCKKLLPNPLPTGPGYFTSRWRTDQLCTCSICCQLYEELCVEYLIDPKDSVKAYEERATNRVYLHEAGLEALGSTMGHVQQVEMITGYNYMKEKLKQFLGDFADKGKVVRSRDITDFFGELESSKRQRLEDGYGIPPDSCHQ